LCYPLDLGYLVPDDRRYNIYVDTLLSKLSIDEGSVQFFEDYMRFDGVASGKCGFTTIRKFQIKKPNFSAKHNRESEIFSYFIIFI
jgi:hypothetical protein